MRVSCAGREEGRCEWQESGEGESGEGEELLEKHQGDEMDEETVQIPKVN